MNEADLAFFSARRFDRAAFDRHAENTELTVRFLEARLTPETASLAAGSRAVCLFIYDDGGRACLERLAEAGVGLVALRSAGFNHVDLEAAEELGLTVARVPAYSPNAVAEHAVAMLLTLNRKTHKAYLRVREGNFGIDGLMGFDVCSRTIGVIGTGKIGARFAAIAKGFGARVLGSDPFPDPSLSGVLEYMELDELLATSDIVSLHCPLTPESHHLIDERAFDIMKPGAMLINTSRGALVDTDAAIGALKSGRLGSLALDVYEEEGDIFFQDLSESVLQDDTLARLLTFPNVLVTSHQAFFTHEAVEAIAETTVRNVAGFVRDGAAGVPADNLVRVASHMQAGG
jgi:D-lactate dehydrogenase